MPEIRRTQTLLETPWMRVVAKDTDLDDAPYYSLELADYVAVVATGTDETVAVVQQYRPAVESVTLELPAGLVDAGETPDEAARRELLEETGLVSHTWISLGCMRPDTGRLGNRMWCFHAKDAHRPDHGPEEDGVLSARMWPREDLVAAIRDGSFNHALHLAVLLVSGVLRHEATLAPSADAFARRGDP